MRGSANPTLVESRVHLLQVASTCNSKHNGGATPKMVGSAEPVIMLIFCTLPPETMILMIVKLVYHLEILCWLSNLHMELQNTEKYLF